jgi:hypothetical protein
VKNGDHRVVVTTTHTNLRRDPRSGSGGTIYLDTDRRDRGPEFAFVGGFFSGTDYALLHTEGFGSRTWGEPVDGSYAMRIDYADEQVRMRMSRGALDNPGRVRVAVRVFGTRSDGSSAGLVDWLGEPHSFTRWVARAEPRAPHLRILIWSRVGGMMLPCRPATSRLSCATPRCG